MHREERRVPGCESPFILAGFYRTSRSAVPETRFGQQFCDALCVGHFSPFWHVQARPERQIFHISQMPATNDSGKARPNTPLAKRSQPIG